MDLVECRISEISIRYQEFGRRLGRGARIDLDQVVGERPAVVDAEGQELEPARPMLVRDLLAGRLDCFVPATVDAREATDPATPLDVDDGA